MTLRIPAKDGPIDIIGQLDDGTQIMAYVTGAFPDGYRINHDNEEWRKVKRWLGVMHLFDARGNHVRSNVRMGGLDIEGWNQAADKAWMYVREMLSLLQEHKPHSADIRVRLFSLSIDGITHGLIYRADQPEPNGPVFEFVMLEPLDIMFHPPWDSGEWSS